jgi:hypothetical protein
MATPTFSTDTGFPETVLRGLVTLGPVNLRRDNLTLELGLSLWMRQSGIDVEDASEVILDLRNILIQVAGLDPRREPTPFVGRSPELDLVNLTGYLGGLLLRASVAAQCSPGVVAEWVTQIANGAVQSPVRAAG